MRHYLEQSVYDAAIERLEFIFQHFTRVYVSLNTCGRGEPVVIRTRSPMKCQQRLQRQAVRHHGAPLRLHCFKTICTSINLVMHALHTINSDGL